VICRLRCVSLDAVYDVRPALGERRDPEKVCKAILLGAGIGTGPDDFEVVEAITIPTPGNYLAVD
jgi:hypothetical protein